MGSSRVAAPYVISVLEGLQKAQPGVSFLVGNEDDITHAREQATGADAVLLVVGYTHLDEGEFIPGDISLDESKVVFPSLSLPSLSFETASDHPKTQNLHSGEEQ